jgi:hypothetical protein
MAGVDLGAREGWTIPAPLATPVVLLLLRIRWGWGKWWCHFDCDKRSISVVMWHRYSIAANEVKMATVQLLKWRLQLTTRNLWFSSNPLSKASTGFRKPCQLRDIFHMPDAAGMLEFTLDYLWGRVVRSLVFCVMFCIWFFVLCLLAMVFSVLLRFLPHLTTPLYLLPFPPTYKWKVRKNEIIYFVV